MDRQRGRHCQATLVVTGGREEAVLVTAQSRQRLAKLGNHHIEVEVVPGAGHVVRRDYPDAYHQIVDPWIRKQFATSLGQNESGRSHRRKEQHHG